MTKISRRHAVRFRLALLLAAAACPACAEPARDVAAPAPESFRFTVGGLHYASDGFTEWKLPGALRELSGFTTDAEGRLFGHDDERAVIHQIDYTRGGIVKSFAVGNPPLPGDFEGITLIDGTFCLATSDGVLYLAPEGEPGQHVEHRTIDTGLGATCEIEGIEYDSAKRLLWFACKTPRNAELKGTVTVLAWSMEAMALDSQATVTVDRRQLREPLGKGAVRPSGIALAPAGGDLVLVASRPGALITLAPDGAVRSALHVPQADTLPQLEAIAFGAAGELILGSEGQNNRGRMRVYRVAD